jgi:hypothetical protein
LLEQQEEWQLEGCRVFSEQSMANRTAATIQVRINKALPWRQPPDDQIQIRSQASGLTPLQGTRARWEALRQLCLAHETLIMAAWSEALHRLALLVRVDDPAPDHKLEISRARELLKENAWATR